LAVALLASAIHMAPYWLKQSSTPPGWTFSGNTTMSPDLMQYRVWMRQAPVEGVVVSNKFTAEASRPYLPVLSYYGIGRVSRWTGVRPESLYAYAGAPLAFALTIVLFVAVRTFIRRRRAIKWVFFVILFGGGLGGYVKFAGEVPSHLMPSPLRKLILQPTRVAPVLDDYRQHYVFQVLFDTHFLLIWLAATLSILVLYACFRRPTAMRAVVTFILFAVTTFLHVYSGITLLAVASAVGLLCWRDKVGRPTRWLGPVTGIAGALVVLAWLFVLQRSSGLPYPSWGELPLPVATLLLGYPVALLWLSRGFSRYWQERDMDGSFLVAWVAGCLAVVLAWPFNPYPSRGTMTLQIGLYLLAGSVYFGQRISVPKREAVLIVLLLGATPAWRLLNVWRNHGFSPDAPYTWQSQEHLEVARWLRESGTHGDLLLASPREELWLAPEFPGRHQVAHFFLTVDYERKLSELEDFFEATAEERVRFLVERDVRFLFVSRHDGSPRLSDLRVRQDPESFRGLPGLKPVVETTHGTLFVFSSPEGAPTSPRDSQ
jgi:hypothetical protein